jgi:hypothetical protein
MSDSVQLKDLFLIRAAVAEEALKNPDFAMSLKEDPQVALSQFTGADFSGIKITVVEEDEDSLVFPIEKVSDELTADQLESVAGGAFFIGATAAKVAVAVSIAKGVGAVAGGGAAIAGAVIAGQK